MQGTYGARVYLRGREEPIGNAYGTLFEPDGVLHEIDVSEAFAGRAEIEKVEFLRQRRASRVIENVPLLPELLPPHER